MKAYFLLQYKITMRKLSELGLAPILGILIILVGFIASSYLLFFKVSFAKYIYVLLSLILTSKLSGKSRNDFLKLAFKHKDYQLVRLIENTLVSLPFLTFLLYKYAILEAFILLILALILALSSFQTSFNVTIPTPFSKKPFEFTVGFRNTFYIVLGAYFITAIAIYVDNFNLGIFSLILIVLVELSFYTQPENEYFVWNFSRSPKQFLLEKLKIALLFNFILCLPILLALSLFYVENLDALLLFFGLGCILLVTVILAKYAAYPNAMNLPEGIIIAVGLALLPLQLLFIPYFYTKAKTKLKDYLQ